MNDEVEVTQEERLHDLSQAYLNVRQSLGNNADAQRATALAQLSIAMSLIERGFAEGLYEESEDEEEDEDEEDDEEL